MQTVSSQAWDVPNSNLVINFKKMSEPYRSVQHYHVGVSARDRVGDGVGYSMFNERGDDPYDAFEKLMTKIERAAGVVFGIADACDRLDSIKVVDVRGFDIVPNPDADFPMRFFSSVSGIIQSMDRNGKGFSIVVNRVKDENGCVKSYGAVCVGDEVVFKGKPAYDKGEVVGNLRMAAIGAAALLEKAQGMVWNAMIDSGDSEYNVVCSRTGLALKKKETAENA